jgi:hypothetical protein
MYKIRIEHQYAVRWYSAESLGDAHELFDLLTKTCRSVQAWDGDKMITEYNSRWAEKAEARQHENPLCG